MDSVRVLVGERELTLTNLDKILYPATATTKAQVINYYQNISSVMLPYLANRALTLVRAPNGVDGEKFFEKRCPPHAPEWIPRGGPQGNCVATESASLVWLANLAAIELHILMANIVSPQIPLGIVFDLDPGPPADMFQCCQVAIWFRDMLASLGLTSVAKTSGSEGLHLYVPLNTDTSHEETKAFALALGKIMAKQHPEMCLTDMSKEKRRNKVFIDWSQNDDAKTTVAPYSMRIGSQPMVSTPVSWDEIETSVKFEDASNLSFTIDTVLDRVETHGDPYADALNKIQTLPSFE